MAEEETAPLLDLENQNEVSIGAVKATSIILLSSKDLRDALRKKRDYVGGNSQTGGGSLAQTHFLVSTYQVIFGMPKLF